MDQNLSSALLRAAAVQFRSSSRLEDNLERIVAHLRNLAQRGVHVAAFPECAVTSYDETAIRATTPEKLASAEKSIATACRQYGICAVLGIPYWDRGTLYNGGLCFDEKGRCAARYAKIQLAGEKWCAPGDHFVLFRAGAAVCSMIICHDERYPELVRLPVLAGAQVIFYLSCESDITEEFKIDPYRAQIQARAMENSVYIVHSNAPMASVRMEGDRPRGEAAASNGHSRMIQPDGNLIAEASIWGEDVLVADLDLKKATRHLALRSRESSLLSAWWEEGVRLVPSLAPKSKSRKARS